MALPKYRINLTSNELNKLEQIRRTQTAQQNKVRKNDHNG
jgi:hypothetical protein